MKESYIEGVANHSDPESCAVVCKGKGEALTGAGVGRVLSREIRQTRVSTLLSVAEDNMFGGAIASLSSNPARSETSCTHRISMHENREGLSFSIADGAVGRIGKSKDMSQ